MLSISFFFYVFLVYNNILFLSSLSAMGSVICEKKMKNINKSTQRKNEKKILERICSELVQTKKSTNLLYAKWWRTHIQYERIFTFFIFMYSFVSTVDIYTHWFNFTNHATVIFSYSTLIFFVFFCDHYSSIAICYICCNCWCCCCFNIAAKIFHSNFLASLLQFFSFFFLV